MLILCCILSSLVLGAINAKIHKKNIGCDESSGCNCTGVIDECPDNGLCDPNDDLCVGNDPTYLCGSYGDFLQCDYNGIVMAECGSGKSDDCTGTLCPNSGIYEGIQCNYAQLVPNNGGFNHSNWYCGNYGTYLTCEQVQGSVLIGVCGSGKNEDCQIQCQGYHSILCANSDYFKIDWNTCQWINGMYGEWVYCPNGYVATGHCGSGESDDCGSDIWHSLQCCPLVYT